MSDIAVAGDYLYQAPSSYDEKMVKKKWTSDAANYVRNLSDRFATTDYTAASLEGEFKSYLADAELGFGQIGPVLRLAIAGTTQGPSIFEVMALLGDEECAQRMTRAIEILG